jgi:hypothetical protein
VFLIWSAISILLNHDNDISIDPENIPKSFQIFCFVLSENNHHLTSSRAIIYSWGKRCDRFYFITRQQNTSVDLMTLERFEKTVNITSTTITQHTLNVLRYLESELLFSSYQWFLRATDDSFVIIPNLRRLIIRLQTEVSDSPIAYVGDVERMHEKYSIRTSGSVMLFNRKTLSRFVSSYIEKRRCSLSMIYDHELVACMKQIGVNVNPIDDNLILSLNLSTYTMDKRFKVI